jgi:hypothetical protein
MSAATAADAGADHMDAAAASAAAAAAAGAQDPAAAAAAPKLSCVDVFSGTGGLSLALRDFAETVQYCEWHPYCQQVLVERMEQGLLDAASVHADVRTLHVSRALAPEMVCGGFPCQDISAMGLQRGIVEGKRSSMFYEMMRLVDECPSVIVVFLENVANITKCSLAEVVSELVRRGFDVQWTMRTAGSLGAPHERKRWFALACKGSVSHRLDALIQQSKTGSNAKNADWSVEPERRVTFKPAVRQDDTYDPNWVYRCQCLGNAVVPDVARRAFIELATAHRNWPGMSACLSDYAEPVSDVTYPFPESALVYRSMMYVIPKISKKGSDVKHAVSITLPPPRGQPVATEEDARTWRMDNYPTPRRGITHACALTLRSTRDLPTILVHCEETRAFLEAEGIYSDGKPQSVVQANVNYIEWMMGYPRDWTRAARPPSGFPSEAEKVQEDAPSDADSGGAEGPITVGPRRSRRSRRNGDDAPRMSTRRRVRRDGSVAASVNLNGMHIMMRENPGKDLRQVAQLWNALSTDAKAAYTARAREAK